MLRRRQMVAALATLPLARPAIAQSARVDVLRFVPQSNLPMFDPMFASEIMMNFGYYVFDTLYAPDSHGVIRPQMASGHEVSADGLVWRFRLRDGLEFHDGARVRAVDCVASLQRWSKMDTFGQILARVIEGWTSPDDLTFEIRLSRPFPLLLEAIGKAQSRVAFILPERIARTEPTRPISEPTGSGPYRMVMGEFVSGSRVVFEKFARYRPRDELADGTAGGKVAVFPRIEWHVMPDSATASAALQAGEVDWWEQPQPDLYPLLAAQKDIVLQVDNPEGHMSFLRMNHLQPPFDDVRVRRAVLAAVDQRDYMRAVFGDEPGVWDVCRSEFPCSSPYAVRDDGTFMRGDVAAGRDLLKQAGYAGQKTVVLNPSDNILITPLGEVTAAVMKQIGLDADLVVSDWATIVQRRANRGPVDKGGWSALHSYGPSSLYDNPAVNPMLRGIGLTGWPGWYTDEETENLVQAWLDAPDATARVAIGQRMARRTMAQVAIVPVGQWQGRTAYRRRITGVVPGAAPIPWGVRPA